MVRVMLPRPHMGSIGIFEHITLDGFFAGPNGEIDWFKAIEPDNEYESYMHQQAQSGGGTLLFGRTTYEMMKSFWPTPDAIREDPGMAKVMNESRKIVVSKTLERVEEGPNWKNVELRRDLDLDAIRKLKAETDVVILGSGTIVRQLANHGLIDSYQLVLVPIVLGSGKPLFEDVKQTAFAQDDARTFRNGVVVLTMRPR